MDDCCVTKLKEIHDIADYVWWFQRFVLASPFVLIIPDFDPTSSVSDLVQTGTQKALEMGVSTAINVVHHNKSLPDFVDTVKNLGKIAAGKQMQAAQMHMLKHSGKEPQIAAFWNAIQQSYSDAFHAP